jgi:hypothetical protein
MSSGFLLLHLFLWSFSTSISNAHSDIGARVGLPIGFPSNIIVQPELHGAVSHLWAGSPTFRAQAATIGAQRRYRVAVMLDPALEVTRTSRAMCVMRVYSTGLVTARVTVPSGRQLDELIPHELEHVIEHIEGIDVRRNVGKHGTGAYDAGRGRVETVRATRVGRRARDEVAEGSAVAVLTRR